MEIECRHYDGEKCCTEKNYGNQCNEPFDCNERKGFYNRTDEILHRYLLLEKDTLRKVDALDTDSNTKKHLRSIYSSKVKLLEDLIKDIIE